MRKNTSTILYTQIINDFKSGAISYGDKIVELELCERYGCSRTPLREALTQLEKVGLLERQVNNRLQVVNITKETIDEILNIRIALENVMLKHALKYIKTTSLLEDLRENLKIVDFFIFEGDEKSARKQLAEFSEILYRHADLKYTITIIRNYYLLLYPIVSKSLFTTERLVTAQKEHTQLVNLLEAGDVQALQAHNTLHLENAMKHVRQQLERKQVEI